MAGLLESAGDSLTPEQMDKFKKGFQAGQQLIYQKQAFTGLIGTVSNDPVEGLATTLVAIMKKIEGGLGKLDIVVAMSIALGLLGDVAEALNETGKVQVDQQSIVAAFQRAIEMWLTVNEGRYSDEEIQSASQGAQQQQNQQQVPQESLPPQQGGSV